MSRASPTTTSSHSHTAFQTVGSFGKGGDNTDRNERTKTKNGNENEQ